MDLVSQLLSRIAESRRRIVVIGDVMVDRWVHGRIEQCQDGCSKFVQEGCVVETPGGAANAANCLSNWGVNVSLYGCSSNDCPVKTRYVADGRIVFRADDDRLPESGGYRWALEAALEMVEQAGAVLLSDYDKGFLLPDFVRQVAVLCRFRSVPCVADCKRAPEVYEGCILKANDDWWKRSPAGTVVGDVVITQGKYGPVAFCNGDIILTENCLPPVQCVNHVGAGDCFAAHLTLALAYGFSLKDAAAIAHSAGRIYVQHAHNRPPMPSEIKTDMSSVI